MINLKFFSSAALLCLSISCHKSDDNEVEPDCDCNGKTFTQVTDGAAGYAGGYDFFVRLQGANGSTSGFVTLCEPIDTTKLVKDRGTLNYRLYGKLRDACLPEGIHPIFPIMVMNLDSLKAENSNLILK